MFAFRWWSMLSEGSKPRTDHGRTTTVRVGPSQCAHDAKLQRLTECGFGVYGCAPRKRLDHQRRFESQPKDSTSAEPDRRCRWTKGLSTRARRPPAALVKTRRTQKWRRSIEAIS